MIGVTLIHLKSVIVTLRGNAWSIDMLSLSYPPQSTIFKSRTDHQNAFQYSQTLKNLLTTKVQNLDFFPDFFFKKYFLLQIFKT